MWPTSDAVLAVASCAVAVDTARSDDAELFDATLAWVLDALPTGSELAFVARLGDVAAIRDRYGPVGVRHAGLALYRARWCG